MHLLVCCMAHDEGDCREPACSKMLGGLLVMGACTLRPVSPLSSQQMVWYTFAAMPSPYTFVVGSHKAKMCLWL